jgi:hypothetical protein
MTEPFSAALLRAGLVPRSGRLRRTDGLIIRGIFKAIRFPNGTAMDARL